MGKKYLFRKMKTLKYILLTTLLAITASTAEAKHVVLPHVYMFGFAASFTDSTLYLTDIQDVENVWYDTKEDALMARDNYSSQLKQYMTDSLGQPNRVCLVIFATTKKKAEKKYQILKKKYMSRDGIIHGMKYLTSSDFKFTAVDMSND